MVPRRCEHNFIHRLVCPTRGARYLAWLFLGKQMIQMFERHRESLSKLGPDPWLR
jgi:hypothetical protein